MSGETDPLYGPIDIDGDALQKLLADEETGFIQLPWPDKGPEPIAPGQVWDAIQKLYGIAQPPPPAVP